VAAYMTIYIKRKNENLWHWKKQCRQYPTANFLDDNTENVDLELSYDKPSTGNLCTQCAQIEEDENIKMHSKEIIGDDDLE
jgi:hypothetical protein